MKLEGHTIVDYAFFAITVIVLFALLHMKMNWFFAGVICLAYVWFFDRIYSVLDKKNESKRNNKA